MPTTTQTGATVRHPLLSLFQSAAREVLGLRRADAGAAGAREAALIATLRSRGEPVPTAAPAGLGETAWTCARLGLDYLEARLRGDDAAAARLQDDLLASPCDPGWLTVLTAYLDYFGPTGERRAIPYRRPADIQDGVIPVSPGARIALISDWGTGSDEARGLLRRALAEQPDILIHLGDIYYSGTAAECTDHVERLLIEELGPPGLRIPVFTLSGNHDMYSGGQGYYGLIDRLNTAPMRQRASWFCLRSTDGAWQILAADTGLHDHDPFARADTETFIEPEEEAWHLARIREFGGRTILLSHHPMFSAFYEVAPANADGTRGAINEALRGSFTRLAAAGPIAAWFWGHEHNLCLYQPYAGLARGRCVGNCAVPVFVVDQPYRTVPSLIDPPQIIPGTELGNDGTVYHRGFTMLSPAGAGLAEYFQHTDEQALYSEDLS